MNEPNFSVFDLTRLGVRISDLTSGI